MTRVWVVRETDAVPHVEPEDWPLGTDEPVFWYGNTRVHRDERAAVRYLLDELTALFDEVQRARTAAVLRLAELCQEAEP